MTPKHREHLDRDAARASRRPRRAVAAALAALCAAALAPAAEKPLWLAVARPSLAKALGPLADYRRQEGFETVVATQPIDKALAAAPRKPAFLLLVGDDEPGKQSEPWYLPAKRVQACCWHEGQARQFASDAAWGDLDADGSPDVPVGRIPARSDLQVRTVVAKVLAFERRSANLSDLRLLAWAGAPGFGQAVDRLLVRVGLATFRRHGPGWMRPWAILADLSHPLCGWPADQTDMFAAQLRQGGLLAALIGHGSTQEFHSMTYADAEVALTTSTAAGPLAAGPPAPPAVFFTCSNAAFASARPCLAEAMLLLPGGPVATIGATDESHPLTNYYTSVAMLKALGGREKRLGALWLTAQKEAAEARSFVMETVLRQVESEPGMRVDVEKIKAAHLLLYALLGDPATRLKMPDPLTVHVERKDGRWLWQADRPKGAARLHVGLRRGEIEFAPVTGAVTAERQRQLFQDASAALNFEELARLDGEAPWRGQVSAPGLLRLVAVGPGGIYAVGVKLAAEDGR